MPAEKRWKNLVNCCQTFFYTICKFSENIYFMYKSVNQHKDNENRYNKIRKAHFFPLFQRRRNRFAPSNAAVRAHIETIHTQGRISMGFSDPA